MQWYTGCTGTIALVSDGGRAHCITIFIYYEVHVPCETHHDDNSYHFLKLSVRQSDKGCLKRVLKRVGVTQLNGVCLNFQDIISIMMAEDLHYTK
jgi:hypothetical protein